MDNATHTLAALVLARAGASTGQRGRLAPSATAALVVAANIPDIDYLSFFGGATAYLANHRTWTHSLTGAAVLGAGVALVFWFVARRRRASRAVGLGKLLLVGLLGALSHCVLDWLTADGVLWLWPFQPTRAALDWFPFIDPWMLALLLLGLGLPALFGLIAEEIGARRSVAGVRWGAWLALAACAALAGGRAILHAEAKGQMAARLYHNRAPLRALALPAPLNPFRWHGVVETERTHEIVELTLLGPQRGLETVATLYKPAPSPVLAAALATRTATRFLAWARLPRVEVTPSLGGWRIQLYDLRHTAQAARGSTFVVWIDVSAEGEVLGEELRVGQVGDEPPARLGGRGTASLTVADGDAHQ